MINCRRLLPLIFLLSMMNSTGQQDERESNQQVNYIGGNLRYINDLCYLFRISQGRPAYYPSMDTYIPIDLRTHPLPFLEQLAQCSNYSATGKTKDIYRSYLLPVQIFNERITSWRNEVTEDCAGFRNVYQQSNISRLVFLADSLVRTQLIFSTSAPDAAPLTYADLKAVGKADCIGLTKFATFILRAWGVPSAIDFTCSWGNFDGKMHCWSVVFDAGGKETPFMAGEYSSGVYDPFLLIEDPKNTRFTTYKRCAKVFRRRNFASPLTLSASTVIKNAPALTGDGRFSDVTDKYCPTSDITFSEDPGKNVRPYIYIYNNGDWTPVWAADRHLERWRFRKMGRGILYVVGYEEKNEVKYSGRPFLLQNDGSILPFFESNSTIEAKIMTLRSPITNQINAFNTVSGRAFTKEMGKLARGSGGLRPQFGKTYLIQVWRNGWQTISSSTYKKGHMLSNVPAHALLRISTPSLDFTSRPFFFQAGRQIWL